MTELVRAAVTVGAAAVILATTWWMITPMRSAGFGVIDDHEIASMLDGRDRLPLAEAPREVVDRTFEPVGRFRPAYWLGRVGEAATAGDRPSLWYVDRILLATAAALLLLVLLARWLPPVLAVVPAMAVIAGPYSETWLRLGPSEAYAVPLLVAGAMLVVRHFASRRPPDRWLGLAFVLLPAAGLAKENFLLLTGPILLLLLAVPSVRNSGHRVGAILALLATAATAAGIVWQRSRHGDVYRLSRGLDGTVDKFTEMTRTLNNVSGVVVVVVVTALGLICAHQPAWARNFLGAVAAGMVLLVLPQAWFYSGDVLAPRYYYPAAFLLPIVVSASLCLLWAERRSLPAVLALLVVIGVAGSHVWEQCRAIRTAATANAQFVAQFAASVAEVTALARNEKAVVISTAEPIRYYEALLSTNIFIRTELGARRPSIMMYLPDSSPPADGLPAVLMDHLREVSTQGKEGLVPYVPTPDCLAVLIGPTAPNPCPRAVTMHGIP